MTLYVKHRPQDFDSVVGNQETIRVLRNVLEGDTPHTFLLRGPSGCGKTSLARIMAKHIGCSQFDYQEINIGADTGVDTIRSIIREVPHKPMQGRARMWVLDECHRMSAQAKDALLKPLEDTPEHAFFVLATTDPGRLGITIKGRCLSLDVGPLDVNEMSVLLRPIAREEGIPLAPSLIPNIHRLTEGRPREAIQILESLRGVSREDMQVVVESSTTGVTRAFDLAKGLLSKGSGWGDVSGMLSNLKDDPESARRTVLSYCATVMLKENLKSSKSSRAYMIVDHLSEDLSGSGHAGLVKGCWAIMNDLEL